MKKKERLRWEKGDIRIVSSKDVSSKEQTGKHDIGDEIEDSLAAHMPIKKKRKPYVIRKK
jgi:hypothetical protein